MMNTAVSWNRVIKVRGTLIDFDAGAVLLVKNRIAI